MKVLDFGLAKLAPLITAPAGTSMMPTVAQTQPRVVLGTAGYMAPEQVRGEQWDHRADIFAFGAVLYEMLTARRAFTRGTTVETMAAVLSDDPMVAEAANPTIPAALARVIEKCLAKAPGDRLQTASDLAFVLEGALVASDVPIAGTIRHKSFTTRLAWLAVGVATVAVVVALGLMRDANGTGNSIYRLSLEPPPGATIPVPGLPPDRHFALSPDGRRLAFIALTPEGSRRLGAEAASEPLTVVINWPALVPRP